jgi:hypothetical protein
MELASPTSWAVSLRFVIDVALPDVEAHCSEPMLDRNPMNERDFDARPYSADERRVVDWLIERTKGMVGAGDDPIGFVLASYALVHMEKTTAVNALRKIVGAFDDDGPFIAEAALKEIEHD